MFRLFVFSRCLLRASMVKYLYNTAARCFAAICGVGFCHKLVRNFFLIPVAPICLIVNFISLIFSRKETSKADKLGYMGLFLSEILFMGIAWFFLWGFFVALNGGV